MNKLLLTVHLKAETQLHVGAGEAGYLCDAPVYRRVDGTLVIPGTSVGGSLRSRATRLFPALTGAESCLSLSADEERVCGCPACRLFGDIHPDAGYGGRLSSKLLIHDAQVHPGTVPSIRDGVGIDRTCRVAGRAAAAKYDYETLPRGTRVTVKIEGDHLTEQEEVLLAALLAEIGEGRVHLGGKSARGLGRLTLEGVEARRLPNDGAGDVDGFLAALAADDWFEQGSYHVEGWFEERLSAARRTPAGKAPGFLRVSGRIRFTEAFLTRDSFRAVASGFDAVPLLAGGNGDESTYLPGATMRGIMRHQAERIARTLAGRAVGGDARWAVACDLFCDDVTKPGLACSRREVPAQDHCLACRLFGSTKTGSRLKVADAWEAEPGKMFVQDHLAIDRFTGGGSDGRKFDAVAVYRPAYHFEFSLEEPEPWEAGWLLLVLRDIDEGLVMLGSGAAKGLGQARIEEARLTVMGDWWLPGVETFSGALRAREMPLSEAYRTRQAAEAVRQLQQKISSRAKRRDG
ncbi:hypothetical protein SY88_01495 [Clostridiales bacterium PH28_bin88]|nr:hypothetical protein SY88_01495 [Clostridiales bacterium PH28_bin88]